MENKSEKSNRGGKRREGINQKSRHVKIDQDLIEELEKQKNINRFINEAIREKLANTTPAHS